MKNNRENDVVEAMLIDVSQIGDVPLSVDTFRKMMPNLRFLKFYCPWHVDLFTPPSHVIELLRGVQDFVSNGSEIHIKSLEYLLIDGYSGLKEFSVPWKVKRQLNLTDTGVEILNSSIGHLSNLECSDMDDLQFKNLPSKLFCLRSTYYLRLFNNGGQYTRKPKLHILVDGLRYYVMRPTLSGLRYLVTLYLSELPGNINFLSKLRVLCLDGSSVEMLPVSIKHLLGLKRLSLRGCRRLLSLPELPPSIQNLDAHDCILLETVEFSSTAAALPELQYADISLQNCLRLDAEKFNHLFHQYVRALVHGYELRRTRTGAQECKCFFISPLSFCYPGSRVPEWFTYHGWGASVTSKLAPASNDLFSCLLCVVLCSSSYPLTVQVKCQSYLEDGNMPRYATGKHCLHEFWMDLNSDHVYIWYSENCGSLLCEIKAIRDDQCTSSSYNPKVTFEFSLEVGEHSSMPKHELDGLIKECGICPLYLSDYHNFIKPKRHGDVFELEITEIGNGIGSPGDQETLPPTKKLKELV